MSSIDPATLIGKGSQSPEVVSFLAELGDRPEIDSFAGMDILDFPRKGLSLYFDLAGEVVSIFLFVSEDESHSKYEGELPAKLALVRSKKEVLEQLGMPSRSGRHQDSNVTWDRFDFPKLSIHVQYAPGSDLIGLVTLMSPSMAQGQL